MLILFQENYMKKTLILLKMNEIMSAFIFEISDKYYEANEKKASTEKSHKYLQLIDNVMYKIIQTCSNYVFQISHLAFFFQNSSFKHWDESKQLMHYIHSIVNYWIIYSRVNEKNADLINYSDTNFAVCKMTCISTKEYIFMLNDDFISWSSKHQSMMTLFTTETEYYALSQTVKKTMWLQKLFTDLEFYTTTTKISIFIDSVKINVDSTEVIKMTENSIENEQIKHFDICYHFVCQKILSGCIQLNYILMNENIADSLTKLLVKPAHQLFINRMRLNLNTTSQAWYMVSYTGSQPYKACSNRASTAEEECWKMAALEASAFSEPALLSR